MRACAPPDRGERLADFNMLFFPLGQPVRPLLQGTRTPSAADVPGIAAGLIAAKVETLPQAAEGCDVVAQTGLPPAAAGARSLAEKAGIPYVYGAYCPVFLPSPLHRPVPLPGRPLPADETNNRVLWNLVGNDSSALFGEALNTSRRQLGLPDVGKVYEYAFTKRPLLAADSRLAPWPMPSHLDVLQTGAWTMPDIPPLPDELLAFLDAGTAPVYVGFGSMPMSSTTDIARVAIEAIRARDRRAVVSAGAAGLAPIDDGIDCFAVGEVNQQALFPRVAAVVHHGGAGTTSTATRAGAPQVVVPQMADQPYWARRVAELGIGAAHDGPAATTESLEATLAVALSSEVRGRAAEMAGMVPPRGRRRAQRQWWSMPFDFRRECLVASADAHGWLRTSVGLGCRTRRRRWSDRVLRLMSVSDIAESAERLAEMSDTIWPDARLELLVDVDNRLGDRRRRPSALFGRSPSVVHSLHVAEIAELREKLLATAAGYLLYHILRLEPSVRERCDDERSGSGQARAACPGERVPDGVLVGAACRPQQ